MSAGGGGMSRERQTTLEIESQHERGKGVEYLDMMGKHLNEYDE